MNRPKPVGAWGATLAAALDMFALILLARVDSSLRLLTLFGACELVLIVTAVRAWKQYFEELIDFMIDQIRKDQGIQQEHSDSPTSVHREPDSTPFEDRNPYKPPTVG